MISKIVSLPPPTTVGSFLFNRYRVRSVVDLVKSKGYYALNQKSILSETREAFYWLSRDAKMCVSRDEGPSILEKGTFLKKVRFNYFIKLFLHTFF